MHFMLRMVFSLALFSSFLHSSHLLPSCCYCKNIKWTWNNVNFSTQNCLPRSSFTCNFMFQTCLWDWTRKIFNGNATRWITWCICACGFSGVQLERERGRIKVFSLRAEILILYSNFLCHSFFLVCYVPKID
jgi:hypothetical protein